MQKNYRIGLDIGIGSVGWAVLENNPLTEEADKILDLGVRTFDSNEVPDTGKSVAEKRREARGVRRRKRRKQFRKERILKLVKNALSVTESDIEKLNAVDVYKLRALALSEKLKNEELAKVILNILNRRGFKSGGKNGFSNDEEGKLKGAINSNLKFLQDSGYETIGEAIYKDRRFKMNINHQPIDGDTSVLFADGKEVFYNVRNHEGDYKNCFDRQTLKNELELILTRQGEFGNSGITEEFKSKVLDIFEKQRNFDEGPGKQSPYHKESFDVGECTFIKGKKRAPKASYSFELFTALGNINKLRVNGEDLSFEDKKKIYEYSLEKESVKFSQIRKLLALDESKLFNLCNYVYKDKNRNEIPADKVISEAEKKTFVKMSHSYEIKKALSLDSMKENKDLINEVATMLSLYKSDERKVEYIQNSEILQNLSEEQVKNLKELNFEKFGSLSIEAIDKINDFMLLGQGYDEACKSAGFVHTGSVYNKKELLQGKEIRERLQDITSNVVKRAIHQTIKILNNIIKKYGSPQFVSIELARDLSRNYSDRKKVSKRQEDNEKINQQTLEDLTKEFGITKPTGFDLVKKRLYEEQGGKCMYSGRVIDAKLMFSDPNYVQVDHILPFSKSMNNSYNNKVLVLAGENQNKLDRTPYQWFGSDEKRWAEFEARVMTIPNREKRNFLLKKNFGEEEQKEFISRNLNDTCYIAKFMFNLLQDYLLMAPSKTRKEKKQVKSVNGGVTSYLRKFWGIDKVREDGDVHHAVDALVIAVTDDAQIKRITEFNQRKERFVFDGGKYIHKLTGEAMTAEEKEKYQLDELKEKMKDRLPEPYDRFLEELKLRTRVDYNSNDFDDEEKLHLARLGYTDEEILQTRPIFVSKMKTVKFTGPIHKETIMSARQYEETGSFVKTVSLENLSLANEPELVPLKDDKYPECSIKDYYKPETDRLLYLKLKEHLKEVGRFKLGENICKPCKDGSDGPVVKKVKLYLKKKGVVLPNGGAENGAMHRVDVYEKDEKFYLCPVYMKDVYAKILPNKLIEFGKDKSGNRKEWLDIDNSYNFKFTLYKNDLIKVKSKSEIILTKLNNNPRSKKEDKISNTEFLLRYNNASSSTASLTCFSHDSCYKIDNLGVRTLQSFEKYYVDEMGKVFKAQNETKKEL